MSRRKKRAQKDSGAIWGVLLGLAGLLLLGGLGASFYYVNKKHIEIDPETNCPVTGPSAIHVIMIDRSDPISPQQVQRIKQEFKTYELHSIVFERYDLYVLEGDTKSVMKPVVSLCNPGDGSEVNELIANRELNKRRFEENFVNRLDSAIDGLMVSNSFSTSPIIESIKAAAITSFGEDDSKNIPRKLTIVSDMVQNTKSNSHYRGEDNFINLYKSSSWPVIQPNLRDAKVKILYIYRPEAKRKNSEGQQVQIQTRIHQIFWENLIKASHGDLAERGLEKI